MNSNNWLIKNCTLFINNQTLLEDAFLFVKNGKIHWLGHKTNWNYNNELPNKTEIIDLKGGVVLPGFHDAHLHPLIGGIDILLEFRINPSDNLNSVISKLKSWKENNPNATFLRGSGWNYNILSNIAAPKKILDEIFPNIPVFLKSVDGHAAWVNSSALKLANIDISSTNLKEGKIEVIPQTNEASGIIKEWPAMILVADKLPKPSFEDYVKAGKMFLEKAFEYGITSFHDAQAKDPFPQVWHKIISEIDIPIKITASRKVDHKKGKDQINEILDAISKYNLPPYFKIISAKVFIDGVIEGNTAYLLYPYKNNPNTSGNPIWESPASLGEIIFELNKYNIPIHAHAVGDAAVKFVLDSIEYAQNITPNNSKQISNANTSYSNNISSNSNQKIGLYPHYNTNSINSNTHYSQPLSCNLRHQIAHADLVSISDMPRIKKLGVILNYQPAWFCKDSNFNNITLAALGDQRTSNLYPLADLIKHNVIVAFSSDWPFGSDIITFNPLEGIQTSVLRYSAKIGLNSLLNPNQKIPLFTAINCYTLNSHYANYLDDSAGSLDIGKDADIVIYNNNIFNIPIENWHELKPIITLVNGILAHRT